MFAVIANEAYKRIINTAIGSSSALVYKSYGQVEINQALVEVSRLSINTLILHRDVATDMNICEALKTLKVLRPYLRVIFISPNSKPGDSLLASLIAKGVYDIFCPKSQCNIQQITYDLQKLIYGNKATYADAARWDVTPVSNSDKIMTIPVTTALVINVTKCAGSTTLASSLAGEVKNYDISPAVIELPHEPHLFYTLGLGLLENNVNKFYSYPHIINNGKQPEIGKETVKENTYWIVADPRLQTIDSWCYTKMMRLLYCCKKAGVIIVDGGSNLNKDYIEALIPIVDLVVAVIDPLPAQIIKAKNNITKLLNHKNEGSNIIFAVNKWSKRLPKNDFSRLISVKPQVYVPYVNQDSIYKAAYACTTIYSRPDIREQLQHPMKKLISLLLPQSVISKAKKRQKLFMIGRK